MFANDCHNPWSRMAIPKRRPLPPAGRILQDGSCSRENAIRINSHHLIRTVLHRRRPLCVLTQRKARHAERGGFLLYSPRVSEHDACLVVEREEIEISERIQRHNSNAVRAGAAGQISPQTKTLDALPSSRVNGEKYRKFGSQVADGAKNTLQRFGIVYVGGPMESEHSVGAAAS